MKNYASIDIGSNSILLLIAQKENGSLKTMYSDAKIAGLGKGIDKTKKFSSDSMDLAYSILTNYKKKLDEYKVSSPDIFITATEASRSSDNAGDFFEIIKNDLGLEIKIISGQQEATYASLGAVSDSKIQSGILLDIGGASSELIKFENNPFKINDFISLGLGSVRATDWRKAGELTHKFSHIFQRDEISKFKTKEIIAIAGTVTSIAAMILNLTEYSDDAVEGMVIKKEQLFRFCSEVSQLGEEELIKKFSFLGKRSSVIIGGMAVLESFIRELEVDEIRVSTRGLRHGILVKEVLHNEQ